MGLYTMGVPQKLVKTLQKQYNINIFVETGTYMGGTSVWASDHFKKVITIENSRSIFEKTSNRYKNVENIDFLYGNSKEHLKNIVLSLDEVAIFWLDAHWSGGETYGINDECPLIEEIKIINNTKLNHIILIDDARLFIKPPPPPHKPEQWANISQIISQINEIENRYCFIADDVIGVVPNSSLQNLSPYFADVTAFEQRIVSKNASFFNKVKRKLNF